MGYWLLTASALSLESTLVCLFTALCLSVKLSGKLKPMAAALTLLAQRRAPPQPVPVPAPLPLDSISQLAPRPPPWRPRREDGGARVALGYCALPAAGTGAACCPSAAGTGPAERSVPPIPRRARGRASSGARCLGGGSRAGAAPPERGHASAGLRHGAAGGAPCRLCAGGEGGRCAGLPLRGSAASSGSLRRAPLPGLGPAAGSAGPVASRRALWLPGEPGLWLCLTARLSR